MRSVAASAVGLATVMPPMYTPTGYLSRRPRAAMDQAAKNASLPNSTVLVGFDASSGEIPLILSGRQSASVAQFPYKIGFLGVDTLWKVVQGKKVPKNVDTGTALVTKANANKFK